jgi:archaellum biogenesis ATPase FlaH
MIVGTTGGGKTLVAQNIAENMALFADVCYVPLEMTEEEMVARSMSAKGKVPINKVTSGKWSDSETEKCIEGLQKYNRKLKKQGRRLGIFSPPEDMSFDEIVTFLHPYAYDVIVVDYVSLLKGADGDDQWRALTNISRQAKIYAKTHKKIVVLLAQLSEEGKIRYARGMLENANLAMTFLATEATKAAGEIPVVMPKARGYDPTPIVLKVNYPCMLIEGSQTADKLADPKDEKPNRDKSKSKGVPAKQESKAGKSSYFDDMET